jgi:hypothetical protein
MRSVTVRPPRPLTAAAASAVPIASQTICATSADNVAMASRQPSPQELEAARSRVRGLANWLDAAFRIPGTRIRIGLEPIIGLIPMVGDVVGLLLSASIVFEAVRLGAPGAVILRMLLNLALDALIGLIPVLGDLFDFGYKANLRNSRLLEQHLDRQTQTPAATPQRRLINFGGLAVLVSVIVALAVLGFRWLLATV